jgi:hypothetical protein
MTSAADFEDLARHCERSEAIHFATCGGMDCFVASLLAMTVNFGKFT